MGNKVKISEFIEFKNDFSDASANLKSQLKEIEKNIETLRSMSSFAGEAANGAKEYFNDVHQTILKSFEHLFTDLEERMEKHETTFSSRVDSSETAIIYSDYLLSTEKDMDKDYESFIEEKENIRKTLADVSDISSANNPYSFTFDSSYTDTADIIIDTEEDLESYASTEIDNAAEIEELFHNLETTIKDSGAVSGNDEFTYLDGMCPASLQALEGFNHKGMMKEATETKEAAVKNMDEESREIASGLLHNLEKGKINEKQYHAYLEELKQINKKDAEGDVSKDFVKYVVDNKDDIASGLKSTTITAMIERQFLANGYDKIDRARLIHAINAEKPGTGSYMKNLGDKALKAGNTVMKGLTAVTIGYGTYDDYKNTDKELGEAAAKNTVEGALTGTISAGVTSAILSTTVVAGAATPVGWAVLAGMATATVVSIGFNYAYDNNFLGLQDGLDWVGNKAEKVGDAITGFFKNTVFG